MILRVCGNIYKPNYLLPWRHHCIMSSVIMDMLFSYAMHPSQNARLGVAQMQYEFFFIYYMILYLCNFFWLSHKL